MLSPEDEQWPKSIGNFRKIPGVKLYRCGSPETATKEDVDRMLHLGIGCVVDLRLGGEFPRALAKLKEKVISDENTMNMYDGNPFDNRYPTCDVKTFLQRGKTPFPSVDTAKHSPTPHPGSATEAGGQSDIVGNRVNVDMLAGYEYAKFVVSQMPVSLQLRLPFMLARDAIFRSSTVQKEAKAIVIGQRGLLCLYTDMIDNCGKNIVTALTLLSLPSAGSPLVCCVFGKDRTGLIVALTLSVLGKTHAQIADDYSLSQEHMDNLVKSDGDMSSLFGMSGEFIQSPRPIMIQLLEYIEQKYQSVPQYLTSIGFGNDKQQKLRDNLTSGCRY